MPIISHHPQHYTTWNLVSQVYNEFVSDKVTVIDTMWRENKEMEKLVSQALDNNHKVVVMNWLDELRGEFRNDIYQHNDILVLHYLWPLLKTCEQYFQPVEWDQVQPNNFDYNFMCYGFKEKPWRKKLYRALQDTKVKGLLSYGTEKNFTEKIEYTWGNSNMEPSNDDPNFPKTVDIYSLGDMTLWRSHFLNIVSESQVGVYEPVWITEKTFKPIIGGRPFIVYGHPDTAKHLQEIGFEIFDEDFGHTPDPWYKYHAYHIADIVKEVSTTDVKSWYEKLLPKIEHNFHNWTTYAQHEHNKMISRVQEFLC